MHKLAALGGYGVEIEVVCSIYNTEATRVIVSRTKSSYMDRGRYSYELLPGSKFFFLTALFSFTKM